MSVEIHKQNEDPFATGLIMMSANKLKPNPNIHNGNVDRGQNTNTQVQQDWRVIQRQVQ